MRREGFHIALGNVSSGGVHVGERGNSVGVEISIYSPYSNSLFLSLYYIVHTCIKFMLGLSTCLSILLKKKRTVQNIRDIKMFLYFHASLFDLFSHYFSTVLRKKKIK